MSGQDSSRVSEGKGCPAKCEGDVARCVSFNWTGQPTDLGLSQQPTPKALEQLSVYDQGRELDELRCGGRGHK